MRVLILFIAFLILSCAGSDQVEAPNPAVATEIRTYLDTNFGLPGYETSWYEAIERVEVESQTVNVHTNLESKNDAARGVCGGVSGFVFSNDNRALNLQAIRILSKSGVELIERSGRRGSCE